MSNHDAPVFDDTSTIPSLGELSLIDVQQLQRWCQHASRYDSPLYTAHRAACQKLAAIREVASTRRKTKNEELAYRFLKWALVNLKEGTRLKMKGCRDNRHGKGGIRIFMNWGDTQNLVCRQVIPARAWGVVERFSHPERLGQVTEHFYDKVTNIEVPGVGYITVKKFLETINAT